MCDKIGDAVSNCDLFWIAYCLWQLVGMFYMTEYSGMNPFEYEHETVEIQFIVRTIMFITLIFIAYTAAPIIAVCRYVIWNMDGRNESLHRESR